MVRTAWNVFVYGDEAQQEGKKPSKAAGFKTKFKTGGGSLQVVAERGASGVIFLAEPAPSVQAPMGAALAFWHPATPEPRQPLTLRLSPRVP